MWGSVGLCGVSCGVVGYRGVRWGVVGYGAVWCGVVRCGAVWWGMAECGAVRWGVVGCDGVWQGTVGYGEVWWGMVGHGWGRCVVCLDAPPMCYSRVLDRRGARLALLRGELEDPALPLERRRRCAHPPLRLVNVIRRALRRIQLPLELHRRALGGTDAREDVGRGGGRCRSCRRRRC